jgi:hypothetical protein
MAITYEKKTGEFNYEYIEMATEDDVVSFIPIDPANVDYQQYLKQLEESSN